MKKIGVVRKLRLEFNVCEMLSPPIVPLKKLDDERGMTNTRVSLKKRGVSRKRRIPGESRLVKTSDAQLMMNVRVLNAKKPIVKLRRNAVVMMLRVSFYKWRMTRQSVATTRISAAAKPKLPSTLSGKRLSSSNAIQKIDASLPKMTLIAESKTSKLRLRLKKFAPRTRKLRCEPLQRQKAIGERQRTMISPLSVEPLKSSSSLVFVLRIRKKTDGKSMLKSSLESTLKRCDASPLLRPTTNLDLKKSRSSKRLKSAKLLMKINGALVSRRKLRPLRMLNAAKEKPKMRVDVLTTMPLELREKLKTDFVPKRINVVPKISVMKKNLLEKKRLRRKKKHVVSKNKTRRI